MDLKQEQQPPSSPPMATPLSLLIPVTTTTAITTVPTTVSRRLPPPCWTPDETSALIDSYRDKWYSLRRGNLRAAHWQDVADDIHRLCPTVVPPKTAVQCRHKMEKLRKRYRAELNRAKSIPHHRFSSSWVYFSKMEAMEKGPNNTSPVSLSEAPPVSAIVAASQDLNGMNHIIEEEDDDDDDDDGDGGYGVRNFDLKKEFERDYGRNGLKIKIAGNSGFRENPNPNSSYGGGGGYRSKYASINNFSSSPVVSSQFEDLGRYGGARVMKNNFNGIGNNSNNGMNMGGSMNLNNNMNMNNGMSMRNVMMKKESKEKGKVRGMLGKREREREEREDEGAVAMEMVEAIRVLGEGFVRMEKMKMEMMRETERMRMEMEMKRTEMILESQHRIVEAFAKGWADTMDVNDDNNKDGSC